MPPLAAAAVAVGTAVAAAPLAAISTAVGVGTSLIGGVVQAEGAAQQGRNAQALGQYQSEQYQQESETSVARAQRKMEEQQRKGQLTQSMLVARGAGAGLNPSVGSVNVLGQQIQGRNTYAALSDLAAGEDVAAGYDNQAASAEYQGDLTESRVPEEEIGSYAGAASSAFGTLGKAAANFG